MKKNILIIAFCLTILTITSFAQTNSSVYFSISYIKLKQPSQQSLYEDLLRNYGAPVSKYRLSRNTIQGWFAYELTMPSGTENEYDFAVVTVSKDMQILVDDTTDFLPIFQKVFSISKDSIGKIFDEYGEARNIVKTEIYQQIFSTNKSKMPPQYAKVNFMKTFTGKDSAYIALEENEWSKLHNAGMEKNIMADNSLDKKILPLNINSDFNYLSIDYFYSIPAMFDTRYFQSVKTIWNDDAFKKVLSETNASRTFARSEIWKLVAFASN